MQRFYAAKIFFDYINLLAKSSLYKFLLNYVAAKLILRRLKIHK